jgi:hypothetical protein
LIRHRLIFLFAALLTSSQAVLVAPSYALNWEGHDDWFNESVLMQEFVQGVPPPILKPLPTCAEMRKRQVENSYEQVAIPGGNCVEVEPGAID